MLNDKFESAQLQVANLVKTISKLLNIKPAISFRRPGRSATIVTSN